MLQNNIILQLKDFLLMLRDQHGFTVDVSRLEDCLDCIHDITDVEEVVYRLQSMICKDEEQILTFRSVFGQKFLGVYVKALENDAKTQKPSLEKAQKALSDRKHHMSVLENDIMRTEQRIQELTKQVEKAEQISNASQTDILKEIERLQNEMNAFSPQEAAKQSPRMERQLKRISDKAKDSISKAGEVVRRRFSVIDNLENEIDDILSTPQATDKLRQIINQLLHTATHQGNQYIKEISPIVKSLTMLADLCDNIVGKDGRKELNQKQQEKEEYELQRDRGRSRVHDLQAQLKWAEDSKKRSEQKLDTAKQKTEQQQQKIKALEMQENLVVKQQSERHRDVFTAINAKAVQTTAEQEKLLSEPITQLSYMQMQQIATYIRTNVRAFRQTLRRTAATPVKRRIDMRATMMQATKTGGEPMMIKYRKPIKSHAKIVCLVDISGSCRQAASVALYFMALMDEAFPGGCHKFAFVDHLVPVDQYFRSQNASNAIDAVNDNVSSRGIYSDYGTTLHQLREDYSAFIGQETTVIILGDARNNRNDSREEDVHFFCTHARKVWWLNPDDPQKWGTGDSVTREYQRAGVDMRHIANTSDLLEFLSSASEK